MRLPFLEVLVIWALTDLQNDWTFLAEDPLQLGAN